MSMSKHVFRKSENSLSKQGRYYRRQINASQRNTESHDFSTTSEFDLITSDVLMDVDESDQLNDLSVDVDGNNKK